MPQCDKSRNLSLFTISLATFVSWRFKCVSMENFSGKIVRWTDVTYSHNKRLVFNSEYPLLRDSNNREETLWVCWCCQTHYIGY